LLRLHLISIKTTERNDISTHAGLLAQQKMAELLARKHNAIGSDNGVETKNGCELHWQTNVKRFELPNYQPHETPTLRKVSVEVNWKNGSQRKHFRLDRVTAPYYRTMLSNRVTARRKEYQ
jgi:hypothetical protein